MLQGKLVLQPQPLSVYSNPYDIRPESSTYGPCPYLAASWLQAYGTRVFGGLTAGVLAGELPLSTLTIHKPLRHMPIIK